MRIRSIKPEFWRSEDVAALSIEDRLLFIGLWSYVDDNGVGLDNLAAIIGDLFAADMVRDSRETLARVSEGVSRLSGAGLIVRYTVDGKRYLAVTGWGKHQRIDKPGKDRYPAPTCENAVITDTLATPSRDSRDTLAPGTGEQGNRGTGEETLSWVPDPTPPTPAGGPVSGADAPSEIVDAEVLDDEGDDDTDTDTAPVPALTLIAPDPTPTPPRRHEYPAAFEDFWRDWPGTRKQEKKSAHTEWVKARRIIGADALDEGVERLAQAIRDGVQDPNYVKEPFRWLKGRGWEAEYRHPARRPPMTARQQATAARNRQLEEIASRGATMPPTARPREVGSGW